MPSSSHSMAASGTSCWTRRCSTAWKMPGESWRSGDMTTITSGRTHRSQTKHSQKRVGRLSNLRAPRPTRLPKPPTKTIKPKPANSRYQWGSLGGQVRTFVAQAANEFCYNHIASFLVDAKSPSASKSMVTFYFDNMVSIKNRRRVWGLLLIRKRLNFLDPKGSITLPCNCGLAGWPCSPDLICSIILTSAGNVLWSVRHKSRASFNSALYFRSYLSEIAVFISEIEAS